MKRQRRSFSEEFKHEAACLVSERTHLRALSVQSPQQRRLWRLLKRRAKLVKLRGQMDLSLQDLDCQLPEASEALASIKRLPNGLTAQASKLAKAAGWGESLRRLETIPGVGKLNALALVAMYHRGEFSSADRFIAFLGLDVRVRDSGTFKGRRKLTKKGDPEVRRLLFDGARAAANRYAEWAERKHQLMARGFSEIQVSVILARKIARIGYALMKTGGVYQSAKITCTSS